jgi:serine protease Do
MKRPSLAATLFAFFVCAAALSSVFELSGQDEETPPSFSRSLTALVKAVRPSVVLVDSYGQLRRKDSIRRDLFRDPEMGALGSKHEIGAGLFISRDGLILTHAINVPFKKQQIFVTTYRGRFEARLLVHDSEVDAALLKIIDPTKRAWPDATWHSQKRPVVGSLLLSFGNPFGTARDGVPSSSLGVVSAFTEIEARDALYRGPVIVTDASINPGCYGGPAFDMSGRLLGINGPLRRAHRSGALLRCIQPIAPVLKSLKQRLLREPPYLGILVATGRAPNGLPVVMVQAGSPAEKAGVRAADRIRRIDSTDIHSKDDMARVMAGKHAGDGVRISIARGQDIRVIELTLGRRP